MSEPKSMIRLLAERNKSETPPELTCPKCGNVHIALFKVDIQNPTPPTLVWRCDDGTWWEETADKLHAAGLLIRPLPKTLRLTL